MLLFEMCDRRDPTRATWWVTPGGGLEGDESHEQAAHREAQEELGLVIPELGSCVWERTASFHFEDDAYLQYEKYFLARVSSNFTPTFDGWTDLEKQVTRSWRWWTKAELVETKETYYPTDLAEVLDSLA